MKITGSVFKKMTSLSAIFESWDHFRQGKRKRKDIQCFERNLEDNIWELQNDLMTLQYTHAPYSQFTVSDPKERTISKATVKDRLVHQIVYSALTAIFDNKFIFHSLSSRLGKGTHIGVKQLQKMIHKVSMNGKQPCYALKMDIKRFFDSINHRILKTLIRKNVKDEKALKIIDAIIDGFKIDNGSLEPVGIPLGNATSQLFANIYLHELDDFIKQELREPYYLPALVGELSSPGGTVIQKKIILLAL
jgi:retron-type reverse transcriptase